MPNLKDRMTIPSVFARALPWLLVPAFLLVQGCSSTVNDSAPDYQSAKSAQPLDVPPDLTAPQANGRFDVPGISGKTYSEYQRGQQSAAPRGGSAVLVEVPDVTVGRDGGQIWLSVALPAEEVWLVVREFWQENGFVIAREEPEIGILDTDWAENRAKVPTDFIRNKLAAVFDSFYSSGERDKFRTRLEKTSTGTDIFVTHRGLVEVFADEQEEQTRWQPRPSDPSLEAELLKRLMVQFGGADLIAAVAAGQDPVTRAQAQEQEPRVKTVGTGQDRKLELREGFDRAWRSVGLALDRTGFTVEDRDRSKGTYFVRYIDPLNPEQKRPGAIARLFGAKEPEPELQSYRIVVGEAGSASQVTVEPPIGVSTLTPESAATAGRMIGLLEQQLKR